MSEKNKKANQDTNDELSEAKAANSCEMPNEDVKLDLNKMQAKDLRAFAQALIAENTELEKKYNELQSQTENLKKVADKAAQLSNMYTSMTKDFEAYRNRNKDIEKTSAENAVIELGLKIVPVYENLKRAIDAIEGEKDKEGVMLIYKQFADVLSALNIEEIICDGMDFDPYKHNAIMAVDTDNESLKGKIKQVFSGGYICKDKVIKQSQVVVYK